jgi:hypothetical protein
MAQFEPDSTTGLTEAQPSIDHLQHPGNTLPHRHGSKLGRIMDSIRSALSHEHEKLPETHPSALSHSQERDTTSNANESNSPAMQAVATAKLNENAMGEEPHWGWPGLGTFRRSDSMAAENASRRSNSNSSSGPPQVGAEAAVFEAIENAAEADTYGWPGLGTWPDTFRK